MFFRRLLSKKDHGRDIFSYHPAARKASHKLSPEATRGCLRESPTCRPTCGTACRQRTMRRPRCSNSRPSLASVLESEARSMSCCRKSACRPRLSSPHRNAGCSNPPAVRGTAADRRPETPCRQHSPLVSVHTPSSPSDCPKYGRNAGGCSVESLARAPLSLRTPSARPPPHCNNSPGL